MHVLGHTSVLWLFTSTQIESLNRTYTPHSGDEKRTITSNYIPAITMQKMGAWVPFSRQEDLRGKSSEYLYKDCRLCQDHFEDSQSTNAPHL
ncbi:hypothetical protein LSAT2_007724 [Lamellibrachia satsuma]|nr:hypothetical protein LSAT2_007724 [Lamellibrachia satsuma]